MSLSDKALLEHLNKRPELRSPIESMLLVVVADEMGELQEADAAEMALIEHIRRMRQESLQAWASGQSIKAADDISRVGYASHTISQCQTSSSTSR